ncbi:MAG: U32 family peptidase [Bacilli bacterium]|nr:U32 family peptidase [Bacilli bacterium]
MKKHELLIPAGDMDCLRQAVYHGADAVYLACKNFGARKFAPNFTNEEIVEAIRFCHLYGVKLYVTMNTLVKNHEVDSFLEQAAFLHKNGVDALIVQDFGMICLLREKYPNLEIHASTQANNSSIETCKLFYDLGVKRVVFSRELSIEEIDQISIPIEKEVFIHGALCVSYSGCCLMSSMIGGRSGNRGECAGSCRLPYSLLKDQKVIRKQEYLLSMKELNTSSQIERLLNSSIDSFKVEGRMKGPLYVGFITSFYRKLIDQVPFSLEEEIEKLKTIFNREFTLGYLFHESSQHIINPKTPNHIGLKIGKATLASNKIRIALDKGKSLHQHDSIRFLHQNKGMVVNYLYDQKDKLCSSSSDVCYVDNKIGLEEADIVMKTQDCLLEKEYLISEIVRKIPIAISVVAKKHSPLKGCVSDGVHQIEIEHGMVEEAKSSPITQEEMIEKMSKLGNTPFMIQEIQVDMDSSVFIPIKMINELRRFLIEKLIEERMKPTIEYLEKEVSFSSIDTSYKKGITCFVKTEEQLVTCLAYPFIRIYVSSKELYEKYHEKGNLVYYLGRCHSTYQDQFLDRNMVGDVYSYPKECYGGYYLNIMNIYTAYYLQRLGLKNIPLSCELSVSEVSSFVKDYHKIFGCGDIEYPVYGRMENMIIKGNILNIEEHQFSYQLKDIRNHLYPVFFDGSYTYIYHYENRKILDPSLDVNKLFIFYDEKKEEIQSLLREYNV